jgi:hypothetical protein
MVNGGWWMVNGEWWMVIQIVYFLGGKGVVHSYGDIPDFSEKRLALLGFPEGLAAFLFWGSPRIKKRQDSETRSRGYVVLEDMFYQFAKSSYFR